jgi:hypothetical protein
MKWDREMECFKRFAQPIEDWAQVSQTIAAITPTPESEISEEKSKKSQDGSTVYRDLRANEQTPGERKN